MRVRNIYKAGGYKLPLLALAVAAAALLATLLASAGQAQAQSCDFSGDLGTLKSQQTITRVGVLLSSDCSWDSSRYFDSYAFELLGTGEVTAELQARDFSPQIQFNAWNGDLLAYDDTGTISLTRLLPAGKYKVIATSCANCWNSRNGSYTMTLKTGRVAEPPQPPPPAGASLTLSVSDDTVSANDSLQVTAALAYNGANQGPHRVSNIALRIAGALEWDAVGGRTLRVGDQSVSCGVAEGQVRCPLRLVDNGQSATITIPQSQPGSFTISASANIGGQTVSGSRVVTVSDGSRQEQLEVDGNEATSETEVVRGRVIVRVHPLPENSRGGSYHIEFGFLSEDVLNSGTDRTAVVRANEHLLPSSRYLTETKILENTQANNRNWLRSSPIDVLPLEGDDADLSGEPLLTGRVIVRWIPTSGGQFRIEFGFLPDWAFEAAGGNTQRAAEMYADLLPDPDRFLWSSKINSEVRRDAPRWLRSSLVVIGDGHPCTDPVAITPIAVPLTLPIGKRISNESIATISGKLDSTFEPVTVTGLPQGLDWARAATRADGCGHQITVSGTIPASATVRNYSVRITAEGVDGEPTTQTIRIDLEGILKVAWDGYSPASTSVGGSVTIQQPRVTSPIPAPSLVTWEFRTLTTNICTVHRTTGALTLRAVGACDVTVTASATGYASGEANTQVTVTDPIPVIQWSGYARNSMEFGDAAPTRERPTATVNGELPPPGFRFHYSVAPDALSICSVNEVTGALTIMAAGTCEINLTNLPGPGYGVGRPVPASVRVNPGDPGLRWSGYSPETVQSRNSPPTLLQPTAVAPTIRFGYESLTPSICSVNSQTGALTLVAEEGACIVQVSTSGDPNYRTARTTATVSIDGVDAPVIDVSCSSPEPEVDAVVTCWARLVSGDPPNEWDWRVSGSGANPSRGEGETFVTRFSSEGMRTISLEASNAGGPGRDSTTVDVSSGNEPPTCSRPSPRSVSVESNGPGSVYVDCTDPDGDRLTITREPSNTGVVIIESDSANPWVYLRGVSKGTATITVTASDGPATSEPQTFSVTVTNGRPVCDIPSSVTLDLEVGDPGASMDIVDVCTDPDGDRLTFAAQSSSDSVVSVSTPSGPRASYAITAVGPGSARITVSATDPDGLSGSASFPVTVDGDGPSSLRISCSPSSIVEGESVRCEVTRNRGGAISTYSWSAEGGSPSSGSRETYSPTFSRSGRYTVSLIASNAAGSDDDDDTVTVTPPPVNTPPVPVGSIPSVVVGVNFWTNQVDLTSYFRDRDGDTLRYEASSSRNNIALARVESSDKLRIGGRAVGSATITVTATDPDGASALQRFIATAAPRPGRFVYCLPDTTKVYFLHGIDGKKHHMDMSWRQLESVNGGPLNSDHLPRMSSSDCDIWPTGEPYDYETALREVTPN